MIFPITDIGLLGSLKGTANSKTDVVDFNRYFINVTFISYSDEIYILDIWSNDRNHNLGRSNVFSLFCNIMFDDRKHFLCVLFWKHICWSTRVKDEHKELLPETTNREINKIQQTSGTFFSYVLTKIEFLRHETWPTCLYMTNTLILVLMGLPPWDNYPDSKSTSVCTYYYFKAKMSNLMRITLFWNHITRYVQCQKIG